MQDDKFFEDDEQEESDDSGPHEEDYTEDDEPEDEEPYREDMYGEYAELLNAIREWRARVSKSGGYLGEGESVSMETLEEEVAGVLQKREELDEELKELPEDAVSTWQKEKRQLDREGALRRRLLQFSVGLSSAMLGDVADSANHLIEDAFDEESRLLRKELRAKLGPLSRKERASLIRRIFEDGRIDQGQFSQLMAEFS